MESIGVYVCENNNCSIACVSTQVLNKIQIFLFTLEKLYLNGLNVDSDLVAVRMHKVCKNY